MYVSARKTRAYDVELRRPARYTIQCISLVFWRVNIDGVETNTTVLFFHTFYFFWNQYSII